MNESRPDLSIVLPAYNEASNIAPMAAKLKAITAGLCSVEIIFVDDGSRDGTLAVLRVAAEDPTIRYLSFTRNFGHQQALRAGLRYARGHAVIIMDADFEHPPELIPDLVAAWRTGAKIVVTQRIDDDVLMSAVKRVTSRLYYRLLDTIGDTRIAPGSADYVLLDRVAVDLIADLQSQDIFLRGLVRWLGFPFVTVPFVPGKRHGGRTKFTLRRMVEFAITGIAAHSIRPLRFAVWLSAGFVLVGFLLAIYSIVSFLFVRHTVAGWSSIMAAIAILGAAQFLVLGIIGEYIGRILRETRHQPTYIVSETEQNRNDGSAVANDPRSRQASSLLKRPL
jgi:polyisoprenyl-phosphate glycosyltransferase